MNAQEYRGLTREKAFDQITNDLKTLNLIEKEVDHISLIGHCDRCATRVEPWLSNQWFVKAEELAKEAIKVVEQKQIKIIPENWEKTYFEWMRNIRPGALAVSYGGGIEFLLGIAAIVVPCWSPGRLLKIAPPAKARSSGKKKMYWTPGLVQVYGLFRLWAGQKIPWI